MLATILKRQLSDTLDPDQFNRFWLAVDAVNAALDGAGDVGGSVLEYVRIARQDSAARDGSAKLPQIKARKKTASK